MTKVPFSGKKRNELTDVACFCEKKLNRNIQSLWLLRFPLVFLCFSSLFATSKSFSNEIPFYENIIEKNNHKCGMSLHHSYGSLDNKLKKN